MIQLLIADDDSATREMMGGFFTEKGYFVFLAGDREEALKPLGEEKIDLIISDYQIPGTDGKGLFRRVKRIHPSLPVILRVGWALHSVNIFMGIFPSPIICCDWKFQLPKLLGIFVRSDMMILNLPYGAKNCCQSSRVPWVGRFGSKFCIQAVVPFCHARGHPGL